MQENVGNTYGIRTFGCYVYCFFVWQLMLYFAGANIIINEEPLYKIEPLR